MDLFSAKLVTLSQLKTKDPSRCVRECLTLLPQLHVELTLNPERISLVTAWTQLWGLLATFYPDPRLIYPPPEFSSSLITSLELDSRPWTSPLTWLFNLLVESQWKTQALGKFGGPKPATMGWQAFYIEEDRQWDTLHSPLDRILWATCRGHSVLLEKLLSQSRHVTLEWRSLCLASLVYRRLHSTLLLALSSGFSIDTQDTSGWTLLHWAAYKGDALMTDFLLTRGANPNIATPDGITPLFWAAGRGNPRVAQLLLRHHARADALDGRGHTPLHWALYGGHITLFSLLLKYPLPSTQFGDFRWTLLHLSVAQNHLDMAQILIQDGADIESKDDFGRTPLHWACQLGNIRLAKLLVASGAFVNGEDHYEDRPYQVATLFGHPRLASWLYEQGAH